MGGILHASTRDSYRTSAGDRQREEPAQVFGQNICGVPAPQIQQAPTVKTRVTYTQQHA